MYGVSKGQMYGKKDKSTVKKGQMYCNVLFKAVHLL